MKSRYKIAVVVAGFVLTLGGAVSWGQVPSTNDTSDTTTFNTGGGKSALKNNTGFENTAYGFEALMDDTNGADNTASGAYALSNNTSGGSNTASGAYALVSNTTGVGNTASGQDALYHNTTGRENTADGLDALANNTSGYYNTATGDDTLGQNTTGYENTATGFKALSSSHTTARNTATGAEALNFNDSGSYNTAVGYRALYYSQGSRNLALGFQAGSHLHNGDFNIYVGNTASVDNTAVTGESNTMRLGQVQTRTFIAGIRGVNVGSTGVQVVINSSGQLGTLVSSARYKRDIADMRDSSQGLYHLRPVTFRYKQDAQGQRQYGLIAEEVAKVYPELVVRGAKGEVESVQYHELIPMLLNEVQRQQQELAELRAQNERLQAALVQQTAALAARLEQLEKVPRVATVATR
jgi:hypothetical protein